MTVDERMAELAETLRQLRAEDTRLRVFGSPAHRPGEHADVMV
jgi:hypothetical protein